MKKIIRVGTRDSKLAIAQTNIIINRIKGKYVDFDFIVVPIKTKGDLLLDTRLDQIGGKGLFLREIEKELLLQNIDMAVHSLKDMPLDNTEGLKIAALSKREDPRDALVSNNNHTLLNLPKGATIGTSSLRRSVQLLSYRPDLKVKLLRGNILTRLDKLFNHEYDAIILAAAGLKRLKVENIHIYYFDVEQMVPATGQGILAVQTRLDYDAHFLEDTINSRESEYITSAERAYAKILNGGCAAPIAAHAELVDNKMEIYAVYAKDENSRLYKANIKGEKENGEALGKQLAEIILKKLR